MRASFFTLLSPLAIPAKDLEVEILRVAVSLEPMVKVPTFVAGHALPSMLCAIIIDMIECQEFDCVDSAASARRRIRSVVGQCIALSLAPVSERILGSFEPMIPVIFPNSS
jgi:hypothetical protein